MLTTTRSAETDGILRFLASGIEAEAEKIAACDAKVVLGSTLVTQDAGAVFRLSHAGERQGVLRLARCDASMTNRQVALLRQLAAGAAAALTAVKSNAEAAPLASIDPVTGLANRRQLDADLARECAAAQRHHRPVALAVIDIDDFKRLNDEAGHPAGDAALRLVGAKIAESVRTSDTVYRHGGDEFAVLLPDTAAEDAGKLAERARLAVRSASDVEGLTVSIGVVSSHEADSPERFLARADAALYDAKRRGRDRVAC